MMMSLAGNVECVQLLLDMGAEVNQQDEVSVYIHYVHITAIHAPYNCDKGGYRMGGRGDETKNE